MDDVINRKDAIGAILSVEPIAELSDGDAVIRVSAANYVLGNLPSAQPVHNTGKWVRGTSHGLGVYNWTCKCGHVIVATVPDRFCGACGCDNAERRTDE